MNNDTKQIAGVIFGMTAGLALYKFFSMPKEKRQEICTHIKDTTNELLNNAEDTVEKVEHYMDEFNSKGEGDVIDKLYVLKKMFRNLYGTKKNYLL
ncbi:MAG: hypothetical protein ABI237_01180 [Ginsengibacter sp.]